MGLLSFSSSFPSLSLLLPHFRPDPKSKPLSIIEMRQTDGKKKKKKERPTLVRLVSTAGTGFFYVAKKTKKAKQTFGSEKLEVRKFDPCVRRHVLFTEGKIK